MNSSRKFCENLKILAVDDGKLPGKHQKSRGETILVGVKMEKTLINDVKLRTIKVDGLDATEKILEIIDETWPIELIILGGISYGGFNLIDAVKVWEKSKIPIIIVSKEKPDNNKILAALKKHFKDWERRWNIIRKVVEKANGIHEVYIKEKENPIYIENIGLNVKEAISILRKLTVWGRTPEPIRIAHIIARGISTAYLKLKNYQ